MTLFKICISGSEGGFVLKKKLMIDARQADDVQLQELILSLWLR